MYSQSNKGGSQLSQRNYTFRVELRRRQLESLFAERRREMGEKSKQRDREEFNQVYSTINEHNFAQHIQFMLRFSHEQDYNFMLLPLGYCLYQYMLQHRDDERALIILEGLSEYSQLEMPWTEEICEVLVNHLDRSMGLVVRAVCNLFESGSGGSPLRDGLLQAGWLYRGCRNLLDCNYAGKDHYQSTSYFYVYICSLMLQTHPFLPEEWFSEVAEGMSQCSKVQSWKEIIVDLLHQVAYSFQPTPFVSRLLFQHFGQLCIKHFYEYQAEITSFIGYCFRTEPEAPQPTSFFLETLELLAGNLSSPQQSLRQMTVPILSTFVSNWQQSNMQNITAFCQALRKQRCLLNLTTNFSSLSYLGKRQCLKIIYRLLPFLLQEIEEEGEKTETREEYTGCLEVILQGLGAHGPEMAAETATVAIALVQSLYQRGLTDENSCWVPLLDRVGLVRAVQELSLPAQGELGAALQQLQQILHKLIQQ